MLEVEGLQVAYGSAPAIDQVDLRVEAHEAVAVIGSNGAGKSTLLRAISGLLPATAGEVTFNGGSILGLAAFRIARAGIACVPSQRHLFPSMTVQDNLAMGAYPARPHADDLAGVTALFPRLAERSRQLAGTLSGGEQQMLAIGRALMARPDLLILDEPTTGLAPGLAGELYEALHGLRDRGVTLLLAEQHVALALGLCDRGYVLDAGRIEFEGSARELRDDPRVQRAYLGAG